MTTTSMRARQKRMKKKRSDRTRLHILCEDPLTVDFAKRIADRWGIGDRQRRIFSAPKARGSAEQYVRAHYVEIVDRWRAQRHENVILLVIIDGDNQGVDRRRRELADALRKAKRAKLRPSDPVAILVPTWHIETWIAWLSGHRPLDEHTRYNGRDAAGLDVHRNIERGEYSPKRAIAAWSPPSPDEATHVPSLADARAELKQRLDV